MRPAIWPRPELLEPADLAEVDGFVAYLAAIDVVPPGIFARAVANTVAYFLISMLENGTDASPEASACRVLAIADLIITKWKQSRDRRAMN
jgi:hypothetical protein